MSKKDYQAIARAFHKTKPTGFAIADAQWGLDHKAVADVLADDNPAFDRQRFVEACETGTTRGMRK